MNQSELDNLRHSSAHLLAAAVMEIWPNTKRTIGPAIENGFYYDFQFSQPISEKDFSRIDQKMRELLKKWEGFERKEVTEKEAKELFKDNPYKLELIEEISQKGEALTLYTSGNYIDLCRGGHVENPKEMLRHFKLLSIAGAYWRGNEKNTMLTRIYGTSFPTKEELEKHLWMLEEAKKRDHKKIGKELELFLISDDIGAGLPIFTPKGTTLRTLVSDYLTHKKQENGYQFVWTPHIAKSQIYHTSGHWGKYDAMFSPMKLDDEEYVLKPMNCPHHFQVYLYRPRSYKDLPYRIAENGTVYRYEKSGEVSGLLRVRALTIDDTHTFVRISQTAEELEKVLTMIKEILKTFGFDNYKARISISDPANPSKYLGSREAWEKAEKTLQEKAEQLFGNVIVGVGEAAFYGPKIDVMVQDSLGREWQLSTVQLDYNQPQNFHMVYTNEEGKEEYPAILHIAMIGSLERLLGILIEHYAGAFPVWLSPIQVAILPISDKHREHAQKVLKIFQEAGIRAELNDDKKTLGAKIRHSTLQKVPYMVIIGDKEIEGAGSKVSVRTREGKDLGQMGTNDFVVKLKEHIENFS
ncbi:MAG: threonine--tRNA ligase [bacterium]|nr:threonine--tRNA ligase [bacterium]